MTKRAPKKVTAGAGTDEQQALLRAWQRSGVLVQVYRAGKLSEVHHDLQAAARLLSTLAERGQGALVDIYIAGTPNQVEDTP